MTKGDQLEVGWEKGTFFVGFLNSSTCNKCDEPVHWVETRKGKKMLLNDQPNAQGIFESHFGTCAGRDQGGVQAPANTKTQATLSGTCPRCGWHEGEPINTPPSQLPF